MRLRLARTDLAQELAAAADAAGACMSLRMRLPKKVGVHLRSSKSNHGIHLGPVVQKDPKGNGRNIKEYQYQFERLVEHKAV